MSPIDSQSDVALHQFVVERVRYRANRLQYVFGVSDYDVEDLSQQMHLAVASALRRYAREKATERTYVCRVLDREYCNLAKKLRVRKSLSPTTGLDLGLLTIEDGRAGSERARVDLALDVAEAVSALPDGLRDTALALMHHEPANAADSRGLHRGTVYRQMKAIEPHLAHLVRND